MMTELLSIDSARPWSLRPGADTTVEQLARACYEHDLTVEYSFPENEIRLYQRDLNTEPPTAEQLAETMFGPDNRATLIEDSPIDVIEIGRESEIERARRLAR